MGMSNHSSLPLMRHGVFGKKANCELSQAVKWIKSSDVWQAEIIHQGKEFLLGFFDTKSRAQQAYLSAAKAKKIGRLDEYLKSIGSKPVALSLASPVKPELLGCNDLVNYYLPAPQSRKRRRDPGSLARNVIPRIKREQDLKSEFTSGSRDIPGPVPPQPGLTYYPAEVKIEVPDLEDPSRESLKSG